MLSAGPWLLHPTPSAGDTFPAPRGYTGSVGEALDVEALSLRYGAMVLRRCRRLLRDEDEALDACQDVFVRLLVHRRRLDGAYPSSLLYRIATNVCLNRIRDRARGGPSRPTRSCSRRSPRRNRPGAESEARMLLDWLFGRQPESSRTIAVLHYVDGSRSRKWRGRRDVRVGRPQAAAQAAPHADGDWAMNDRVPDLILEQYRLGELPPPRPIA